MLLPVHILARQMKNGRYVVSDTCAQIKSCPVLVGRAPTHAHHVKRCLKTKQAVTAAVIIPGLFHRQITVSLRQPGVGRYYRSHRKTGLLQQADKSSLTRQVGSPYNRKQGLGLHDSLHGSKHDVVAAYQIIVL